MNVTILIFQKIAQNCILFAGTRKANFERTFSSRTVKKELKNGVPEALISAKPEPHFLL